MHLHPSVVVLVLVIAGPLCAAPRFIDLKSPGTPTPNVPFTIQGRATSSGISEVRFFADALPVTTARPIRTFRVSGAERVSFESFGVRVTPSAGEHTIGVLILDSRRSGGFGTATRYTAKAGGAAAGGGGDQPGPPPTVALESPGLVTAGVAFKPRGEVAAAAGLAAILFKVDGKSAGSYPFLLGQKRVRLETVSSPIRIDSAGTHQLEVAAVATGGATKSATISIAVQAPPGGDGAGAGAGGGGGAMQGAPPVVSLSTAPRKKVDISCPCPCP